MCKCICLGRSHTDSDLQKCTHLPFLLHSPLRQCFLVLVFYFLVLVPGWHHSHSLCLPCGMITKVFIAVFGLSPRRKPRTLSGLLLMECADPRPASVFSLLSCFTPNAVPCLHFRCFSHSQLPSQNLLFLKICPTRSLKKYFLM